MIELEELWSKNDEEQEGSVKICRVAKVRNLQISQHCSPVPVVDCFLTRLFVALYKFSLDVILVHLHIFVISLY